MPISNYLLGRHVTAVSLRAQTLNESTGAIANGAGASDLAALVTTTGDWASNNIAFTVGLLDSIRLTGDKVDENIASVNRRFANHIPLRVGAQVVVSEILRQAANECRLAALYFAGTSKIVELTYARGGNRWVGIFLITGYTETIQRGKSVGTMTLMSVDSGAAIAYTAADR